MQRASRVASLLLGIVGAPVSAAKPEVAVVPPWACSMSPATAKPALGSRNVALHNTVERHRRSGSVTEVNSSSLMSLIATGDPLLVVFFAPWCPHCADFVLADDAPLKTLSTQLDAADGPQAVKFDTSKEYAPSEFVFQYIPAIYLVSLNGAISKYPTSPGDINHLQQWTIDGAASGYNTPSAATANTVVMKTSTDSVAVPPWACLEHPQAPGGHVQLHASNQTGHRSTVNEVNTTSLLSLMATKQPLMVVFYAPWCLHCQRFVLADDAPLLTVSRDLLAAGGPAVVQFDAAKSRVPDQFEVQYIPKIFVVSTQGAVVQYSNNQEGLDHLKTWAIASMNATSLSAMAMASLRGVKVPAVRHY